MKQWSVNYLSNPKSETTIVQEWDSIAEARLKQIDSGVDVSFSRVLAPEILNVLQGDPSNVLDIGCGTGTLSQKIAHQAQQVIAIDPSSKSIELARKFHSENNLSYVNLDVKNYLEQNFSRKNRFDAIIANMVLMDVVNLPSLMESTYELCRQGGVFHATITHPCFWPKYWGYENSSWFSYHEEIQIEAPFRITDGELPIVTTHVHRPLEAYINAFYIVGYKNVKIKELKQSMHCTGNKIANNLNYPKFIMISAIK